MLNNTLHDRRKCINCALTTFSTKLTTACGEEKTSLPASSVTLEKEQKAS